MPKKILLYKFRSLASKDHFDRGKDILENGLFYCSSYWELNDPMEGIYKTTADDAIIKEIYNDKCKYKICSFSGKRGFEKPVMWGYYANGFRGYAVEIEIEKNDVDKIKYVKDLHLIDHLQNEELNVKKILCTKLKNWDRENEYRYLRMTESKKNKIGDIQGIYFGKPYGNTINYEYLQPKENIKIYNDFKMDLIDIATKKGIKIYHVIVRNGCINVIQE